MAIFQRRKILPKIKLLKLILVGILFLIMILSISVPLKFNLAGKSQSPPKKELQSKTQQKEPKPQKKQFGEMVEGGQKSQIQEVATKSANKIGIESKEHTNVGLDKTISCFQKFGDQPIAGEEFKACLEKK